MNNTSKRFSLLLNRFLEKRIEQRGELNELASLFNTLSQEEIDQVLRTIYDDTLISSSLSENLRSEEMLKQILANKEDEPRPTSSFSFPYLKFAAAAILIGFAIGLFIFQIKNKQSDLQPIAISQNQLNDIPPGGNKAILKMANGTTIVLTDSPNGLLARDQAASIQKINDGQLIFDANTFVAEESSTNRWNTVETPRGGQYQIQLPDGSKVWLNAASSLRFPSQFRGKERKVELRGEAYFEVTKHSQQAFKVVSEHLEVQVLGTNFNLSDYDDTMSKTTLINGSVKIKHGDQTKLLKPGQQALLHQKEVLSILDNVDIESEIAWKNGLFIFKDASIQRVMEQIARWYDIEIEYRGPRSKKLLNGSVSRNVNLSELMNMLAYTGVDYEIQERKVIIKN
ncbi:FecR domain-containing protein [Olivibacter sp. CPCC 100613]|uniref:FecR family protein n=1 Tax=Olivibacter sp. CPCC 100613 TaxID=3079931 RepID=UPI002FF52AC0